MPTSSGTEPHRPSPLPFNGSVGWLVDGENFIPLCCNGVGTAQASLPSARAGLTVGGRLCACLLLVVLARGSPDMQAENSTEGNSTESEVQTCAMQEMYDEYGNPQYDMYHGNVMMAPDSSMCEEGTVPQVLVHDDFRIAHRIRVRLFSLPQYARRK